MGCGCSKEEDATYNENKDGGEKPAVETDSIKDPLQRFAKSVPFYRMHAIKFTNICFDLNQEKFPITELAAQLNTPSWVEQFESGQPSYKLIMNLPDCSDGQVEINSIVILGLLWCEGSQKDKAEVIFKLLNPPGQH